VGDVTDKPIEASADEIAGLISRRFADKTADGQC